MDIQLLQYHFSKRQSFLHSIAFTPLLKVSWSYLCVYISGISILFDLCFYASANTSGSDFWSSKINLEIRHSDPPHFILPFQNYFCYLILDHHVFIHKISCYNFDKNCIKAICQVSLTHFIGIFSLA